MRFRAFRWFRASDGRRESLPVFGEGGRAKRGRVGALSDLAAYNLILNSLGGCTCAASQCTITGASEGTNVMPNGQKKKNDTIATDTKSDRAAILGFEAKLWAAADALRN